MMQNRFINVLQEMRIIGIVALLLLYLWTPCRGDRYGGRIINQALNEVLGPLETSIEPMSLSSEIKQGGFPRSKLRIRCENFTACADTTPMFEIDNAIIKKNAIYLYQPDAQSLQVIERLPDFLGGSGGRLPIVQQKLIAPKFRGKSDGSIAWLPGPEVRVINSIAGLNCNRIWDTSAYFLHPWEIVNTFHALNDNVLKTLASIVLQRYTLPKGETLGTDNKSLFLFHSAEMDSKVLIFNLLNYLFEDDVHEATELFESGTNCVRHVTWGNGLKPFYKDSLVYLRKILVDVLQAALKLDPQYPKTPTDAFHLRTRESLSSLPLANDALFGGSVQDFGATQNQGIESSPWVSKTGKPPPRAILVSRGDTSSLNMHFRKIAHNSEMAIVDLFRSRGVPTAFCCNFKVINTIPLVLSYFAFADICMGIHGAGLTNCIFGKPGAIVFEFQNSYNFGVPSFLKIAHMLAGTFVFFDIRSYFVLKGVVGAGIVFNDTVVENIVNTSIRIYDMHRSEEFISLTSRIGFRDKLSSGSYSTHSLRSRQLKFVQTPYSPPTGKRLPMSKAQIPKETKPPPAMADYPFPSVWTQEFPPFWVLPTPRVPQYMFPEEDLLLGPANSVQTMHCSSLPYYSFMMVTVPLREHKALCDPPLVTIRLHSGEVISINASLVVKRAPKRKQKVVVPTAKSIAPVLA